MTAIPHTFDMLRSEVGTVFTSTISRLVVAAILGGIIGLERTFHRKPAGLRTNMFICFGSALFTVLSDRLAQDFGGDHTRIAAQIIPGIGFIGAGAILHARASITGLTTAATIFVAAAVGMAVGGGLYITAVFATAVILIALAVLGRLEGLFTAKSAIFTYEVTGENTELVLNELSRILDGQELAMQDVNAVSADDHSRVVFSVKCMRPESDALRTRLHESSNFFKIKSLGSSEQE